MKDAEQELTSLTDEKKITISSFKPMDPMKVRFLKQHCWSKIKEKEQSCKADGVVVVDSGNSSFEVKGTQEGRKAMIFYLEDLARKVNSKVRTVCWS